MAKWLFNVAFLLLVWGVLAEPALDAPRDAPLADIPGTVPPPDAWPSGCAFWPRCAVAKECCKKDQPAEKVFHGRRCACWNVADGF